MHIQFSKDDLHPLPTFALEYIAAYRASGIGVREVRTVERAVHGSGAGEIVDTLGG